MPIGSFVWRFKKKASCWKVGADAADVCFMLEKIFGLKAAQTTVKSELLAGVTTFAAMSYILAVDRKSVV